jgi:hypothetical protein
LLDDRLGILNSGFRFSTKLLNPSYSTTIQGNSCKAIIHVS